MGKQPRKPVTRGEILRDSYATGKSSEKLSRRQATAARVQPSTIAIVRIQVASVAAMIVGNASREGRVADHILVQSIALLWTGVAPACPVIVGQTGG
jgi:hypothetical protein